MLEDCNELGMDNVVKHPVYVVAHHCWSNCVFAVPCVILSPSLGPCGVEHQDVDEGSLR